MSLRRTSWWRNPAAWVTGAGTSLLLFSLWMPWLSASRTTRIETRADGITSALLDACIGFSMPWSSTDLEAIESRFLMLAMSRGVHIADIERVEPLDCALLSMRNKHYAFQLLESPPDANQRIGSHTTPALEATAWPLRRVGPGHCAFFYPDNAERAYTRNLRAGYAGMSGDHHPQPAGCHRRPGLGNRRPTQYPGNDNERWILF